MILESIEKTIVNSNESEFLEYIHRCCCNILDNKDIVRKFGYDPPTLQLYKMRNEVELRIVLLRGENRNG